MAFNIQPFNFKLTGKDYGAVDYADALKKGFEAYQGFHEAKNTPQKLAEALLQQQLKNKHDETINKYLPRSEEARIGGMEGSNALQPYRQKLLAAQTARAEQLGSQPFGGQLSGAAKEAYALDLLKKLPGGEDNPVYKDAKRAYEANVSGREGRNLYQSSLAETANKRALTNVGKLEAERKEALEGFEPGTNGQHEISPERQQELVNNYDKQLLKTTTDTQARQKTLYAKNIDKTIQQIDPAELVKYSGIGGQLELKKQQVLAQQGKESEGYKKYLEAANNAELLAHQVRQFYGDSIQPSVTEKLSKLTNPSTWKNNPEVASRLYKSFVKTLKNETGTYTSALKGTDVYKEKSENNSSSQYSNEDLAHTAEKYNMSIDQVKRKLGIQ